MKSYKFKIHGNEYEVDIKGIEDNVFNIEVNGTAYVVEMDREIKAVSKTPTLVRQTVSTHKEIKKKEGSSVTKIKCPLPGNIINVFVKKGDKVIKGDKLVIYEAMKMENQIVAEKDGTIVSVRVNVGDSVLQDDVLMEMN